LAAFDLTVRYEGDHIEMLVYIQVEVAVFDLVGVAALGPAASVVVPTYWGLVQQGTVAEVRVNIHRVPGLQEGIRLVDVAAVQDTAGSVVALLPLIISLM
jgi:hypothetical protein